MPAPLYALLGTVLGAAIAGLTSWHIEVRRERTQAGAARRLLALVLRNALEATWEVRYDERWPTGWDREWTATWAALRAPLLTRPPRGDALSQVGAACARLDQLQHAVNDGGLAGRALTGENKLFLWEMQQLLDGACAAVTEEGLGSFAKTPEDPTPAEVDGWRLAAGVSAPG